MAYKNKTYVAFDADSDIRYYRLMTAWKQNDYTNFNFYNAHDLINIWQHSSEQTIKRNLHERLNSTKIFILLIGEKTKYLYRFVRWEIETAMNMNIPLIAVNLNGKRFIDEQRCPPILKDELCLHISFNAKIMQKALEEWQSHHSNLIKEGKSGPFYYPADVYNDLGL
ncbi:MAG: TIR domain-containing protein [Reichenbachiella sp.]|uniref:TIR domain-containing protein n=1 Tax=Reichenbachiella sp. TaxID=2184521 RepID=UPI0032992D30